MFEKHVSEFLAAARSYLLDLVPCPPRAELAFIPVRHTDRR